MGWRQPRERQGFDGRSTGKRPRRTVDIRQCERELSKAIHQGMGLPVVATVPSMRKGQTARCNRRVMSYNSGSVPVPRSPRNPWYIRILVMPDPDLNSSIDPVSAPFVWHRFDTESERVSLCPQPGFSLCQISAATSPNESVPQSNRGMHKPSALGMSQPSGSTPVRSCTASVWND